MKPNETNQIVIGLAMKVHTALGAGILESAYDACLFYELTKAGLRFEHEVTLPIVSLIPSLERAQAGASSEFQRRTYA